MVPTLLKAVIGQVLPLVGQMHAQDEIMRWIDRVFAQFLNQEGRIAKLEKQVETLQKSIGMMVHAREVLGKI